MDWGLGTNDSGLAEYIRDMRNSGYQGVKANYGLHVWIGLAVAWGLFVQWQTFAGTITSAKFRSSEISYGFISTAIGTLLVFFLGMLLAWYAIPRLTRHIRQSMDRGGVLTLALAKHALTETPELLKRSRMLGIVTRIKLALPDEIRNRLWALELSHPSMFRKAGMPLLPPSLGKIRKACLIILLACVMLNLIIVASMLLAPTFTSEFGFSIATMLVEILGKPGTTHSIISLTIIVVLVYMPVFALYQLSALRLAVFRLVLADTLDEWLTDGRLAQAWLAEPDRAPEP